MCRCIANTTYKCGATVAWKERKGEREKWFLGTSTSKSPWLFRSLRCLTDTHRDERERKKSSAKQPDHKVSLSSYPRPQWWWCRSSSDGKLGHLGNNQISYKLSILFHMLSNKGHWAVHHLPKEGKNSSYKGDFMVADACFSSSLTLTSFISPQHCPHIVTSLLHVETCLMFLGMRFLHFCLLVVVVVVVNGMYFPCSPSSLPSQLGNKAKTSSDWKLLKSIKHNLASSHVLGWCFSWMRYLWHCLTVFGGDLAAERDTGERKPEEMWAMGSWWNWETFGIN